MAVPHDTGDGEAVALDFPDSQVKILHRTLTICLDGVSGDLKIPRQVPNPARARREADAYERLLAALKVGKLVLPDEAARKAVEVMVLAIEEDTDYQQIIAEQKQCPDWPARFARRQRQRGSVMDVAGRFADNLVRCRKLASLSQDELSLRASVHRTEISQLERGLRIARIDTLAKLCGGLEVEPGELMEGITWTPGELRLGQFIERDDG